eukprot:IDg13237t1
MERPVLLQSLNEIVQLCCAASILHFCTYSIYTVQLQACTLYAALHSGRCVACIYTCYFNVRSEDRLRLDLSVSASAHARLTGRHLGARKDGCILHCSTSRCSHLRRHCTLILFPPCLLPRSGCAICGLSDTNSGTHGVR